MEKLGLTRYQQKLAYVMGVLAVILFMAAGVSATPVKADTTMTVMLHKVLLDENDTATQYDNQGTELTINESALLNGAGFTVYDVTTLVKAGTTEKELYQLNETYGASYFEEKGLKVATEITGTTGIKGLATFELPVQSNGQHAKYLIIETTHPEIAKLEISQPIFLNFPLASSVANPIHLYPKNYQYVRDPYFYKHGKDSQGKDLGVLAGASFRLYKLDANGRKRYLHEDKLDNNNQWVDVTNPKVTIITSDKNGLVTTGGHWLPVGEYYFEEVTAPEGYEITDEALRVKVTVPADSNQPVTITVAGKTSTMPEAVVDNLKVDLPQTSGNEPPKPSGKLPTTLGGLLPTTGERLVSYIALGGGLFCLVLLVQRKRQHNHKLHQEKIEGDTK